MGHLPPAAAVADASPRIRQQPHLDAPVLLASFRGRVRSHFLVLADADQVEAVRGNPILRRQVLHHRIGAALAQVIVVLGRPGRVGSACDFENVALGRAKLRGKASPIARGLPWSALPCRSRRSRPHRPPACSCPAPSPRCPASRRDARRCWLPSPHRRRHLLAVCAFCLALSAAPCACLMPACARLVHVVDLPVVGRRFLIQLIGVVHQRRRLIAHIVLGCAPRGACHGHRRQQSQ